MRAKIKSLVFVIGLLLFGGLGACSQAPIVSTFKPSATQVSVAPTQLASPDQAAPSLPRPTATTGGAPTTVLLQAEAMDTIVKLTWTAVVDADGYFIYRDGGKTALNPAPMNATTFQDIGLTNGRTYSYTVVAVDRNGQPGARSGEIKATPKSK